LRHRLPISEERFVVDFNCQVHKIAGPGKLQGGGEDAGIESTGAAASAAHAMAKRQNERKIGFTPQQGFWNYWGRPSVSRALRFAQGIYGTRIGFGVIKSG